MSSQTGDEVHNRDPLSTKIGTSADAAETKNSDQNSNPWSPHTYADNLLEAVKEVFSNSPGRTNREWTRGVLTAITLAGQRTAQQKAYPSNEPVNISARYHGATDLMTEAQEKTPELSGLTIIEKGHTPPLDAAIYDPSGQRVVIAEPEQGGPKARATDNRKLVQVDHGEIAVSVFRPSSKKDAASAQKAARQQLGQRIAPSISLGIHIPKKGKMSDFEIMNIDRINFPPTTPPLG